MAKIENDLGDEPVKLVNADQQQQSEEDGRRAREILESLRG